MPRILKAWIVFVTAVVLLAAPPCSARKITKSTKHTVRRGETLGSIADRYGLSINRLCKANKIKNPDIIHVGQIIKIPQSKKSRKASNRQIKSRPLKGAPELKWPLKGWISSRYGPRRGRLHSGIDIAAPKGYIIVAAGKGKVVRAGGGWRRYGKVVLIDHGKGYHTLYAHCSRIYVKKGQRIRKRQAIAAVGATGNATGPHLHFEIWIDGLAVNPERLLPPLSTQVKIARR
ncbi:peptidoglycan DD-metalloendopeptidase family protein [Acidobacteriota bacterium]